MEEYRYPVYKEFEERRIEINDAISALLVGSSLSVTHLDAYKGSKTLLGDMFPAVPHVKRLNLTTGQAQSILSEAEHHLATVSIPYAQSLQEDHVKKTLEELKTEGVIIQRGDGSPCSSINKLNAASLYAALFRTCDEHVGTVTSDQASREKMLDLYQLFRQIRNENTHSGGNYTLKVEDAINNIGEGALDHWMKINNGSDPSAIQGEGGKIRLTATHIFTVFSVMKQLGRLVNKSFIETVSPDYFARLVVSEYVDETRRSKNSAQWKRGLEGYARVNYPKAHSALEQTARSMGYWTRSEW